MSSVRFTMDASDATRELDRLAAGPHSVVPEFEGILLSSFAAVAAKVHVITGQLKSSGHPSSSFDGLRWEGTIHFARHPGIFELARHDHPTLNHPEGGHFFFEPAYETPQAYESAVIDFLRGA